MAKFAVDTKLFQELGALLVGKESTAVVELIKNAYDADATTVTVHAQNLADPTTGMILVQDDGVGMSEKEFEQGFLTVAGRTKITANRRSPVFGRRYTGEKGVGRLATHKLATKVTIISNKAGPTVGGATSLQPAISTIRGTIDWNAIEAVETLDEVEESGAVSVVSSKVVDGQRSGTRLTLTPLRKGWTERMKTAFLSESASLTPHRSLWDRLPKGLALESLLFDRIAVRDHSSRDPGFNINFSGEMAIPDELVPDVVDVASWIAEAEYDRVTGKLRMAVSPGKAARTINSDAEGFRFSQDVGKDAGPTFKARIFQQTGKPWPETYRGIRVYMEGFRVLPYGGMYDDWLDIERAYTSRANRQLTSLASIESKGLPTGINTEEVVLQSNAFYMGAVFLNRSSSSDLQMLVNREGFLPGPQLTFVSHWVRVATDLIVRLKYSYSKPIKDAKKKDVASQRRAASEADVGESPSALRVRESALAVQQQLDAVQTALKRRDYAAAEQAARNAQPRLNEVRELADEFGGEAIMWRVLASLGTELAAFVHEINAIALQTQGIASDLDDILRTSRSGLTTTARKVISKANKRAMELADRIKRNAAYLVDATSFKGRRRRSRLPLGDRFASVVPFFDTRILKKKISLKNMIAADLHTPPMFPSELSGIFINLLSNAVKFTNEGGRIQVRARTNRDTMTVRMENTGIRVDLNRAKRYFDAFRSTTTQPDAVLGQGMGMGLTITRAFVQEYGGEIDFVAPSAGFATAIEFSIPLR